MTTARCSRWICGRCFWLRLWGWTIWCASIIYRASPTTSHLASWTLLATKELWCSDLVYTSVPSVSLIATWSQVWRRAPKDAICWEQHWGESTSKNLKTSLSQMRVLTTTSLWVIWIWDSSQSTLTSLNLWTMRRTTSSNTMNFTSRDTSCTDSLNTMRSLLILCRPISETTFPMAFT